MGGKGAGGKGLFVVGDSAVLRSRVTASLLEKLGKKPSRLSRLTSLLSLYQRSDASSESLLCEKIQAIKCEGLTPVEEKWVTRLKDLAELRGLAFGRPRSGRQFLRQAATYVAGSTRPDSDSLNGEWLSIQDVTESATVVSELYWKLLDTATGSEADLARLAQRLLTEMFHAPFETNRARANIESLTDQIQRGGGAPFMILNLLRRGQVGAARNIAQQLLTSKTTIEEESASALYWMAELLWFTEQNPSPIYDHDSSIRYLYHMCFTNPDRAGFLEVDSRFYSQFEMVNEIAREGFLFKDSLIERILTLWSDHKGYFDDIFKRVLETLTGKKNPVYDKVENWEAIWRREKGTFSTDYLLLIEGNLAYAVTDYDEAQRFYEEASAVNPHLRAAKLNQISTLARLQKWDEHRDLSQKLARTESLMPFALSVIGNSFYLMNRDRDGDTFYLELKRTSGWERKADYYRSTFCYEHAMFEKALGFALFASALNPTDSAVNYHLSLCYDAVGDKVRALEALGAMEVVPKLRWLEFYRFTLQRDSGQHSEATETLLKIPRDYFEDPEELEQALHFAKERQDLALLRHLKKRG